MVLLSLFFCWFFGFSGFSFLWFFLFSLLTRSSPYAVHSHSLILSCTRSLDKYYSVCRAGRKERKSCDSFILSCNRNPDKDPSHPNPAEITVHARFNEWWVFSSLFGIFFLLSLRGITDLPPMALLLSCPIPSVLDWYTAQRSAVSYSLYAYCGARPRLSAAACWARVERWCSCGAPRVLTPFVPRHCH